MNSMDTIYVYFHQFGRPLQRMTDGNHFGYMQPIVHNSFVDNQECTNGSIVPGLSEQEQKVSTKIVDNIAIQEQSSTLLHGSKIQCPINPTSNSQSRRASGGPPIICGLLSAELLSRELLPRYMVIFTSPATEKSSCIPEYLCIFPRLIFIAPERSSNRRSQVFCSHTDILVTTPVSTWLTFRSSTCQTTVSCAPSIILLATHGSYGFNTNPILLRFLTNFR